MAWPLPHIIRLFSVLLLSLAFMLGSAEADEINAHPVQPTLLYGHDGTSSFYQSNAVGAQVSYAPSKEEELSFNDWNARGTATDYSFDLNRVDAHYVRNLGDYHFESGLGIAQSKFAIPEANALVEKTLGKYTILGVSAANALYSEILQTGTSFAQMIRGPQYQVSFSTRESERIRIAAFHRQYFFSDQNSRIIEDVSVFYGISPDWPWIWVGLGVENLLTHFTTPNYWSPIHFVTYGPRADIAFPIGDDWTIATGFNLNRFDEIGGNSGIGYYSNSKVTWKHGHIQLAGSIESILSEQDSNQWTSNGFRFEATWLF